ncbi:elongation factor P hydroxylase [Thalassotalea sp. LPB0316]|uniref:elongation factor P hydroxylase n=1 Tax=Thalassotalea sp. LPB0316 TaxID=2769490 RepID=UPI0018664B19|nr:elongation factor P hydroxylase [Thalassotalea sp. LPB0316]QOL25287.1 elongation factor P hydroxylase [Thalassotalea sp. LPB0316]
MHRYQDLIRLFDQTFYPSFNTRLVKGGNEPIYLPATKDCDYHQVVFAHGYFASGLHEIAHWCIAGEARRQLVDFGYWYEPDGRNHQQQALFESVEIKPQALEWAFCVAANKPFNVSVDNLNGDFEPDANSFKLKVFEQVKQYLSNGFPKRGQLFIEALANFYQVKLPLNPNHFLTPFEQDQLLHNQRNNYPEVCDAEV